MTTKFATYGSDPTQAAAGIANGLRETTDPANLTMAGVADGEFLKRSGSTLVGAAAGAGAWTNAYSIDFTAQSVLDFKSLGNGQKSIGGLNWNWENDVACSAAGLTPGVGIVLTTTAVDKDYNNAVRTSSVFSIPLVSLHSAYSVTGHIVRVSFRTTRTNTSANLRATLVGLESDASGLAQNFAVCRSSTDVGMHQNLASVASVVGINYFNDATRLACDVDTFIWEAPSSCETWCGTYSAGMPATSPNFLRSQRASSGTPPMFTQIEPAVFFGFRNTSTPAVCTHTLTHLRVDYFRKSPTP